LILEAKKLKSFLQNTFETSFDPLDEIGLFVKDFERIITKETKDIRK
jgi:hypothetical protein